MQENLSVLCTSLLCSYWTAQVHPRSFSVPSRESPFPSPGASGAAAPPSCKHALPCPPPPAWLTCVPFSAPLPLVPSLRREKGPAATLYTRSGGQSLFGLLSVLLTLHTIVYFLEVPFLIYVAWVNYCPPPLKRLA